MSDQTQPTDTAREAAETLPQIYIGSKEVPLDEALSIITDEWVDRGNSCGQTVIDLRAALHWLLVRRDDQQDTTAALRREVEKLKAERDGARSLAAALTSSEQMWMEMATDALARAEYFRAALGEIVILERATKISWRGSFERALKLAKDALEPKGDK